VACVCAIEVVCACVHARRPCVSQAVWLITASDHIGSEPSIWTSKWPHRTHRYSFAPQKFPCFDQYVERNLSLLVTSASDSPLRTIKFCSVVFSLYPSTVASLGFQKEGHFPPLPFPPPSLSSPALPSPPLPLPLEVGPLNPARRSRGAQ